MAKCHYIAVPSGIGDSLWAMTKVPDYRKKEGVERLTACVQDCDPRRGAEFLSMFDFIDQAAYVKFPIHYPNRSELNLDGSYCYIESQKNFHGMSWLWIPNGHLELGKRLEHWLPEYRTDFEICKNNLEFSDSDVAAANSIRNKVSSKYAVFFLGNRRSNVSDGHNRGNLWSLHDWLQLGDKLHDLGNQIVVVGAKYDVDYSDDLRKHLKKRDFYHIVTGETSIGTTFDLCRKSECVISFQSGIGIVSVYMGVPTVLWWRPYGNSTSPNENIFISFNTTMSHAWAAPYCIGTQYLPQIYSTCTAKSIMADIERAGWFAKDGPHYGKLLSNGIIKSPEDFAKYCQTRSNRHFVDPPKSSY